MNLLTSILLVFPLFLVYQIGVLAIPQVHNGADLITTQLLSLLHGQTHWYILVNLVLGAAFLVAVAVMRRKNEFQARMFLPVVIESSAYALCMGALIVFVMQNILHIPPSLSTSGPEQVGIFGKIILSFGAGVHEEIVFRLILVSALAAIGVKWIGWKPWVAMLFAFGLSSFLFSAAHHVVGGEPWRIGVFVYRFLCGLVFASLYQVRGFAVAVYTHAIYDVFVLVVHG